MGEGGGAHTPDVTTRVFGGNPDDPLSRGGPLPSTEREGRPGATADQKGLAYVDSDSTVTPVERRGWALHLDPLPVQDVLWTTESGSPGSTGRGSSSPTTLSCVFRLRSLRRGDNTTRRDPSLESLGLHREDGGETVLNCGQSHRYRQTEVGRSHSHRPPVYG